jgi:hypothetical protein
VIILKWLYQIILTARKKTIKDEYGNAVMVFSSSLVFIYIIHSTSQTCWGFYMPLEQSVIAICMSLTSFNAVIHHREDLIKTNNTGIQR